MKGKANIIEALNVLLSAELAAMDQYFLHSEIYADWGLHKLHERIAHEFEDEKGHAKKLIERILFLEGHADMVTRLPIKIGTTVPEMLESDLNIEYEVTNELKRVIALCEQEQDYQTREILEVLLADTEEDHAYWLEQQLRLIKMIGIENYCQSQM